MSELAVVLCKAALALEWDNVLGDPGRHSGMWLIILPERRTFKTFDTLYRANTGTQKQTHI